MMRRSSETKLRVADIISFRMTTETATPATGSLGILEIMEILPHRYPFLLIDRVVELVRMQRIVAIKNITINEPYFQGHFPSYPIMPGVLMVEAMAQAGGALLLTEVPDRHDKLVVFTGIDEARFRAPVVPGDQVRIEVQVLKWSRRGATMRGNAFVDGKLVCEAEIKCQVVPRAGKKTEAQPPQEAAVMAAVAGE
jgi:3-hydroxyacyl-[acyl-carrier-protein] dehydratase